MYKKFELVRNIEEANAITHAGVFHADEVFATALLSMIMEVKLFRTRDVSAQDKAPDIIMYDVGGVYDIKINAYDHHQRSFEEKRDDGIKYSSFGLLWNRYGKDVLLENNCQDVYLEACFSDIDNKLVRWIDGRDNGQLPLSEELTISTIISGFNPGWDEEGADSDACFIKAVDFAYTVLSNLIKSFISKYKAIDIVEDKISKSSNKVLNLEKYVTNWQITVLKSENPKAKELLYGTYIGMDGEFCIIAIPPSLEETNKQRQPFPKEWAGLSKAELEEVTGIKGVRFCHSGRFFMSVDSEETAQEVFKKIL